MRIPLAARGMNRTKGWRDGNPRDGGSRLFAAASPKAVLLAMRAAAANVARDHSEGRKRTSPGADFRHGLLGHWREYVMEAAELGLFMVSALFFATLLEHPDSPLRGSIPNDTARRVLGGLAMGATAIALIYSPWGKQSGAHLNPAVTLTFWRLGRVRGRDAFFYGAAQFLGGATAVLLVGLSAGPLVADPKVQYAATVPGPAGAIPAFFGELLISFLLMTTLLRAMEHEHLAPYTGFVAGALVAIYIAIESPISGMSMNPARTFASAVGAKLWTSVWIYLTAPPIGMLLAAEIHRRFAGRRPACAKLVHARDRTCIFCGQEPLPVSVQAASELARRIGP